MSALGFLARTTLFVGAIVSASHGVVALTAPSRIADALGLDEPSAVAIGTSFGIAVLLTIAAVLLRAGGGVQYHYVRHHDPVDVPRPRPASKSPRVTKQIRAKVAAAANRHPKPHGKRR